MAITGVDNNSVTTHKGWPWANGWLGVLLTQTGSIFLFCLPSHHCSMCTNWTSWFTHLVWVLARYLMEHFNFSKWHSSMHNVFIIIYRKNWLFIGKHYYSYKNINILYYLYKNLSYWCFVIILYRKVSDTLSGNNLTKSALYGRKQHDIIQLLGSQTCWEN